jgi:hypothetical protein
MRRVLAQLGVCLIVGVLLTVVVAWSFALFGNSAYTAITYTPPGPGARLSSASRVPDDFVNGTHVSKRGRGFRYQMVTEMVWIGSRLGMMTDRQNRTIERVEVGWPWGTMEWIGTMDLRHRKDGWTWRDGLEPPRWGGAITQGASRRLPLVALWPGFAYSALTIGAVLFVVQLVPRGVRRGLRRRRGRCVACGYELQGLVKCPECGRSVVKR